MFCFTTTIRLPVILTSFFLLKADDGCLARGEGPARNQAGDYVVLLHGLGRTAWSMKRLEWALTKEGYRVVNVSYPSTRFPIQELARHYLTALLRERTPDRQVKIHFVTHSLGGIVLRQFLRDQPLPNLGRVVMLAPPNHGSELADHLKHNPLFRFFLGPSGQQLGTGPDSVPRQLGPAHFELGVIAGDRSLNPLFSAWLPKPNDGKVSVQSAKLEPMQDFLVVHHTHTWMVWNKEVIGAVIRFLERGQFKNTCTAPAI